MNSGDEIAFSLAKRLLEGERGDFQSHLTMLLEKSSDLRNCDAHYRWILPVELADITITEQAKEEIIDLLCREISQNPDEALICAVSFTGDDLVTRTVATVVAQPPRPLTMSESTYAFSLLSKFLWFRLKDDRSFVPDSVVARIVELAKEYKELTPDGEGVERSLRVQLNHHATNVLKGLGFAGIN